jgi:hypothetical protein
MRDGGGCGTPRPPRRYRGGVRALAVVSAAVAAALTASGAGAAERVSYVFGWNGGNVMPATLTIAADGHVTVVGPPKPQRLQVSASRLAATWKVVVDERFFALRSVNCPKTLPDFATEFITVRTATRAKTVRVHGGCSSRFAAVYAALKSDVGLR